MSRFASTKITIGLPVVVSTVLALVAGGLQTVSQVALAGHIQLQGIIAVFIAVIAVEGIDPISGSAFLAALHLPTWALRLANALIVALTGLVQVLPMSKGLHIAFTDVLTILAALGFPSLAIPGAAGVAIQGTVVEPVASGGVVDPVASGGVAKA